MKWMTVLWVTLLIWVPTTCFAGSGKAVMAHQFAYSVGPDYGYTAVAISNITSYAIAVRLVFRDQFGNIIQDGDNSPTTGFLQADNITNYDESAAADSVNFTLAGNNSGFVTINHLGQLQYGYVEIYWSQDSPAVLGLIAYGVRVNCDSPDQFTESSIMINGGKAF